MHIPRRAILAAPLAACSRSQQRVIGVVPKGVASIFFQGVHAGVDAGGRDLNCRIVWNGPAEETEFARQIQIVDSMISSRVDGILLSPAEKTALVSVVERAMRQGIPVAVFDSAIETKEIVSYIATDNTGAGVLGARQLADLTNKAGKVGLLRHVPGSASTGDRESGFARTLGEYPGMKIVAENFSMSDSARALRVAEDFLTAHPDLSAIFASSEVSTLGADRALRARGLAGKVKLVGFDASPPLVQGVRDGVVSVLLIQDPFYLGWLGVETLLRKLGGQPFEAMVHVPARPVTLANIDSPEIREIIDFRQPRSIKRARA